MIHKIGYIATIDNTDPDNPVVTYGTDYIVASSELLPEAEAHKVESQPHYGVIMGVETFHYSFANEDEVNELFSIVPNSTESDA